MAAGAKAADVLQRVQLARAAATWMQAGSALTATLIARVNTLKAAATSPAEAAQLEAELPQLELAQKDL